MDSSLQNAVKSGSGTLRLRFPFHRSYARAVGGCLAGIASVALVTFVGYNLHLNLPASASLYFLVVVLVSIVSGFWEASITSLVAVNCLNYFFVPPVLTWRVGDPQNWVALAIFEVTALSVSRLSSRVQLQARGEVRQRKQIEKLYDLSRRILLLDRRRSIGPQIVAAVHDTFQAYAVALFDATLARTDGTAAVTADLEELARNAYLQDAAAQIRDKDMWANVLRLGSKPVGGIALCGKDLDQVAVGAIASLAAIALERAKSFEEESRAGAARETEQLRTAVLDALAHAFKTPLTAIRTASSGLLEGGRLSPDDTELAGLIDEQAQHLNRLTSELLQMARIDAADVRLRREAVSLPTLVDEVLARHREQLMGRRVEVRGAEDLAVFGDREILASAFEQFIDNACRYSPPGSPILVCAETAVGEAVISIHNEGPPIRPADRERIFERFYRAGESRHRSSGSGLGLSIAKKAAHAHGGRTWVVSDDNTGTTFFFALPHPVRSERDTITR
jgi:two-component system sensor histidine kinase KdpD